MQSLASETIDRMRSALDDDLNTAQAQAAIFEMVRSANAAFDAGRIKKDDVPLLLAALAKFDEIFAVLNDDDAQDETGFRLGAHRRPRKRYQRRTAGSGAVRPTLDADIEKKIAEMEAAPRPATSRRPTLRAELTAAASSSKIRKTACAGEESRH
jgi:cysteinyl-tRNA synthetase